MRNRNDSASLVCIDPKTVPETLNAFFSKWLSSIWRTKTRLIRVVNENLVSILISSGIEIKFHSESVSKIYVGFKVDSILRL